MVVGLILLVLPEIYLGARLALAFPACTIDECRIIESFKRSWAIAPGRLLSLFGMFIVVLLSSLLVFAGSFLIASGSLLVTAVLNLLMMSLIGPLIPLAMGYVYIERRENADRA